MSVDEKILLYKQAGQAGSMWAFGPWQLFTVGKIPSLTIQKVQSKNIL